MRDTSKVAALDHAMHAAHTWVNEIAREFHPDVDSVGAPPFRHIRSSRQRDDIDDHELLRDQVDLDSMDWLNVIVGLHERFGVDILEADYAKLTTLNVIVNYLAQRQAGPG